MAEQQLDGAQVRAGFEQMGGETVSQSVRMQRLVDSGALSGLPTGMPDHLVANRIIGGVPAAARKQPDGGFANQAPIMGAEFIAQMRAEDDVAIPAALAVLDVHHHACGVDIGEFEGGTLSAAHARGIEGHQNGAVEGDRRSVDQAGNLFRAPDNRKVNSLFRIGHIVSVPGALQDLAVEESERADSLIDGVIRELSVAKQMSGVLADLIRSELIGRTVEITREILNDTQVGARGTFGVVATREFI